MFSAISPCSTRLFRITVLLLTLLLFILLCFLLGRALGHNLLYSINGGIRTSLLTNQDLATLVDGEDTANGSLRGLLQTNGADKTIAWVAKQFIGKILLGLESGVGLGRVARKTVDR